MNRLILLAAALLLSGCIGEARSIASASAKPGYTIAAQAVLAQARAAPMSEAAKAVVKAVDAKAFAAVTAIDESEMRKAADLHAQIQGL